MLETAIAKNSVRAAPGPDHQTMGRGVRHTNGHASPLPPEDTALWEQAFDEARRQGAGPNVARVFANQTLVYARAERDGVAAPGADDFQPYR